MRILFFYFKSKTAATVYDHIQSFQKYSKHNIVYIEVGSLKPDDLRGRIFNCCDVIVIHYTVCFFADYTCPYWFRIFVRKARARKIVFIQDEYTQVDAVIENLSCLKIDALFTCVPDSEIEKVYPTSKLPKLIKINTRTGFVPARLLGRQKVLYASRPVDVCYRSRQLSAWYGRLAREKWKIAEQFQRDMHRYPLKVNISYHEQDRVYGEQWIRLLEQSKAALGCESGASVFDFSGDIQSKVEQYERENPKASFEEIEGRFFKGLDGKIKINQISPRCFEYAVLGVMMILYEGEYSGILKPWQHYIPLKKDHSNMDEVVSYLKNPDEWQKMTNRAYEEIACNPLYSYRAFIHHFDDVLDNLVPIQRFTDQINESVPFALNDFFSCESNDSLSYESNDSLSCESNGSLPYESNDSLPYESNDSLPYESNVNVRDVLLKIARHLLPPLVFNFSKYIFRLLESRSKNLLFFLSCLRREKKLYWCFLLAKKNFRRELLWMLFIKNFLSVNKTVYLGYMFIKYDADARAVEIHVDPDRRVEETAEKRKPCPYLKEATVVNIVFARSWLVSPEIRGKKFSFQYKELITRIL